MDRFWVRIRSWHAIAAVPPAGELPPIEGGKTLCGRGFGPAAEISTKLPAEKSCESCLRIVARLGDSSP